MRCFFGVRLPEPARAYVDAAFAPLRSGVSGPGCSWVLAGNLHLTLRYLGESDPARLEAVTLGAGPVVSSMEAPRIALAQPGFFRARGARKWVLWAGVEGPGEPLLAVLAERLEQQARAAGFAPERRAFQPHVTVARLPPRLAATLERDRALPGLEPCDCTPEALELLESVSGPGPGAGPAGGGVRYRTLRAWPFNPPSPPSTLAE